jgi:PAS domain S-box-containing protein
VELSPPLAERLRRRVLGNRLRLTVAPAALVAGLGAGAVILASDHDDAKAGTIALVLPVGWAFVAAGLVAWAREPANRLGRLLVLGGFAWLLAALSDADAPVVFAAGRLLFPVAYAVIVHLLLAYPSGRLASRADVAIVALAYLDATVLRLPWLMFEPLPSESCPDCPTNALFVADRPGLADAVDGLTSLLGVLIVAYVFVSFARRWRSTTPRGRRVLMPVLATGSAVLLGLAALLVVEQVWPRGAEVLEWLVFALLITVPGSFLVGLLRTRLATAGASRLLLETPSTPTPEEAQAGLRRVLGDPTLELAYWLPERGVYVDTRGNEVEPSPEGDGRMTTLIDYDGRPVAALVHDESLRHERELVDAVVAAARVAIEKDRLQAELRARLDDLAREGEFIRGVIDTSPGLLCVLDREGRVVRHNEDVWEVDRCGEDEDLHVRPFWELFADSSDAELVRHGIEALAAGAPSFQYEGSCLLRDGSRRVFAWSGRPLVRPDGGIEHVVCAGLDVTERKLQEEELQRERDFIRTVVNSAPAFFCVVDLEGTVVRFNDTATRMTGREDTDDMRGRPFWEVFVAPENADAVRERLLAAAAGGGSSEVETELVSTSGERLVLAWSSTPLVDAQGRPRLLVAGTDVTERKRQEREIRASRARIVEAADLERRRLERNLHDGAQQRLVTLSLTLRLVETRLGRDSDAARLLAGARDELAQALEELRDLARGIHPAVLSDHGLGAAIDALAARLTIPAHVQATVGGRLPEAVEVAVYYVVAEALTNVQKYADATEVRIHVARADGHAVVEVRDDGVGGAETGGGSGLRGLADRVEALGGRLEVESPAGAGTTVRAVIPSG